MLPLLPGWGTPSDDCSEIKSYMCCPGKHTVIPIRRDCQRVECPNCWSSWASKASHRVSERLRGVRYALGVRHQQVDVTAIETTAYRRTRRLRHIVFSPPEGVISENEGYDSVFKKFKKIFEDSGLYGATVIYHAYRIRPEIREQLIVFSQMHPNKAPLTRTGFWAMVRDDVLNLGDRSKYLRFSPHFHALSYGALPKSSIFYHKTGWIYKMIRELNFQILEDPKTGQLIDEISALVTYLLSHCNLEYSEESGRVRKTRRDFGIMAANVVKLYKTESGKVLYTHEYISQLKCPICGEYLVMCYDHGGEDGIRPTVMRYDEGEAEYVYIYSKKRYRRYEVIL